MAKIIVEETEIQIEEKVDVIDEKQIPKQNFFMIERLEKITFRSSIYHYEKMSVLVQKIKRFGEDYFKIVVFSDTFLKAWSLIALPAELNIKIKRLAEDVFFVVGESLNDKITSQITFCKLKTSGSVEEVTINFTKLHELKFVEFKAVLICVEEKDHKTGNSLHVLSLYNNEGRLLKNFYEYYDDSLEKFSYSLDGKKLKITLLQKNGKKEIINYDLENFLKV